METAALFFAGIALVLISISFHEFAHAWAANSLGDSTARYRGRVTADPLAHLDPVGTMMILFTAVAGVGIGWGRPVPIMSANFKNPPLGLAISSGAGPVSNLVQAVVAALLLQAVQLAFPAIPDGVVVAGQALTIVAALIALAAGGMLLYRWYRERASLMRPSAVGDLNWKVVDPSTFQWWQDDEVLKQLVRGGLAGILFFGFLAFQVHFLRTAVYINVALALFNLIPLGPLDGNGILRGLLLTSRVRWTTDVVRFLDRIQPYSSYILFGLIMLDQLFPVPLLSYPLWTATEFIAGTLLGA